MSAVLSYTRFEKLFDLYLECKRMGIRLLPPDINTSQYDFTPQENGILYGFCGIKGTGSLGKRIVAEREENGCFTSFHDFYLRLKPKKNELESLVFAGCFDGIYPNRRMELCHLIPELIDAWQKIEKKQLSISKKKAKLEEIQKAIVQFFLQQFCVAGIHVIDDTRILICQLVHDHAEDPDRFAFGGADAQITGNCPVFMGEFIHRLVCHGQDILSS